MHMIDIEKIKEIIKKYQKQADYYKEEMGKMIKGSINHGKNITKNNLYERINDLQCFEKNIETNKIYYHNFLYFINELKEIIGEK